jgi:lipopolysaccharide export system ATP-binding protein
MRIKIFLFRSNHHNCTDHLRFFVMHKGNALDALHRTSHFSGGEYTVPSSVLKVEGLVKIYGKRRVVDGVSFHVNKGEIVGLLGPNGAGKTTSFRMACGLINTNGGVVYLGSQDVTNWPMYRRSREGGMGYLPQDKSVFQKLSVQNNLLGVMEMLGIKRSERRRRCNELLEKFQLTHLRYNYGGGLSGGERRRLEIARSLVSDPKIILLDEPFAAVDPITVTGIQEIIRQLSSEGISILITDHSVQDTLQITQRSYVIQAGKVLCHGTPAEVLSNPEARKVYFGENVNVSNLHSVPLRPFGEPSYEEEKAPPRKVFGRHKPKEPIIAPDPEWDEPIQQPALPTAGHTASANVPAPDLSPNPKLRRISRSYEETYPADHEVPSELRTRPIGKRLTSPERPVVHSSSVPEPATPSPEPATGMSGVIRSLGALIGRK